MQLVSSYPELTTGSYLQDACLYHSVSTYWFCVYSYAIHQQGNTANFIAKETFYNRKQPMFKGVFVIKEMVTSFMNTVK